ncbi:MAG: O-antigen ligase family protein [Clostridium sp.]
MENFKKFCKEKSITFFFPIAFILTIVPLIVRIKETHCGQETLDVFGPKAETEMFSQNKAICLMFFSIILLIIAIAFCKQIFEKKDRIINSILILSFVFLVLTLFSALFSNYKQIALWGVYDRAEGFFTIACYILLFVYSIFTFKTTKDFKCVLIPIIIVVVINAFLGVFQYTGQDLLKTSLGAIFANVDPSSVDTLYNSGNLYGTLYHYNYVGSFAAIVLPILIGSLFFEDDVFLKIVILITIACAFWLLFGSTSRAGLLGVAFSIIFALIIFRKIVFKSWKPVSICVGCIIVLVVGLNFATGGKILSRIPSLVSDAVSIFKTSDKSDFKNSLPIQDIQNKEDGSIEIKVPNDVLKISHTADGYVFKNSKDEIVNYEKNIDTKAKTKTYSTTDETFKNISFRFGPYLTKTKDDGLLLNLDGTPQFMFGLRDDTTIHLINGNSKKDIDLEDPESIGFAGKEKLASSRGYIWSRSLPMLRNTLLLGTGPDTFVFEFPQNDLLGKLYAYDSATTIVDKPHNLYLQIALNEGVIALLAFLGIILIYIVDSIKLYALKSKFTENEIMGISVFLAVIGYLFAGIFNDSVISVAPIFWIVLGVGVAVNFINRKAFVSK